MPKTHVPVLAGELIEALDPRPGQVAVDCTLGAAGHARLVAGRLGPSGLLVGIDRDPLAEATFAELAAEAHCRTRLVRADFVSGLRALLDEGLQADMVYLDLGMSSMQVDTRERGFSYAYDAPLDMRMDPSQPLTAAEIVNTWEPRRLGRLLRDYGEERYADRIAKEIARRRDRRRDRHHVRAGRRDHRRDPRPRAVRRRASGEADVPGDPDRRQRRAVPARRGAPARVGPAARRRPARRDLVPLARGPARQALPRRPHPRLHLPARPAGLRLRARPAGRARVPALRRADAGRGRRQPALEVRPPAGSPQAHRGGGARMTPAPARSHRRIHGRSHAPQAPRRVSGPVQRRLVPAPAGPVGLPRRGTTGFFARVRALPDHRLIDRLLRSRLWIWALGIALLGVVTMQVSLLKLNSGISRAVETTTTLERQNAALEESITKLTATDRIQTGAEALGMLMPAAGDVGYLQARPERRRPRRLPHGAAVGRGRRAAGQQRDRAGLDDRADRRRRRPRRRRRRPRRRRPPRPSPRWRPPRRPPPRSRPRPPRRSRHRRPRRRPPRRPAAWSPLRVSRGAGRTAHRPALRGLPRHDRARRRACRLARRRQGRLAQERRGDPAEGATSSSPPGAGRSPTSTAPSWRSPSPRRRSPRPRT